MSVHRNRMIFQRESVGKENIFVAKQSNKLAAVDSQKIIPRKRSTSVDLDYRGTCNCGVRNDLAINNPIKSSAKKIPFRVHIDRAGNDLGKGVRFRERIAEYDTRRIEKLKRSTGHFQNKNDNVDGTTSSVKKQQLELNLVQDPPQKCKESRAISRNSVVSGSKPIITSIIISSQANLPKYKISTAKSLIDLSQVYKPSTLSKRACDTVKLNRAKLTPIERNLDKKRSLSSSSVNKPNNLAGDWDRVHSRSRSCSNRPSVTQTRNKITSRNKELTNVEKEEIKSDKRKKLGGSKDSLLSGSSPILSGSSKKKRFSTTNEIDHIVEITNHQLTSTRRNQEDENDQKERPLVDVIQEKVQAKVESKLEVVQQNTDFSAYLLYHSDYLVDLLAIEKEKETRSPQLSPEFIDKYSNSESRRVVVVFLIRLTTHCRYPSFILYQAAKIFDAVIDRVSIEGSNLELVAVTALWIVLKKDGNFNKIPPVVKQAYRALFKKIFYQILRFEGTYSRQSQKYSYTAKKMLELTPNVTFANVNTLVLWEKEILRTLDFNITFSDPFSIFVFYMINYDYESNGSNGIITRIYYCGGYIIDLTLLDEKFSYTTSNYLGLTAAELVMSVIVDDEANLSAPRWHYWRHVITNGVHVPIRYYDDEINLLRATMISHILESAKKHTKQEVVRKRYSHNRYGNISDYFLKKIMKLPQAEYSTCM